jgi:hypothetical protein
VLCLKFSLELQFRIFLAPIIVYTREAHRSACRLCSVRYCCPINSLGARGAELVETLCYELEGRGFNSMRTFFQFTFNFQPHFCPGAGSDLNRNEYQESSLGVGRG